MGTNIVEGKHRARKFKWNTSRRQQEELRRQGKKRER